LWQGKEKEPMRRKLMQEEINWQEVSKKEMFDKMERETDTFYNYFGRVPEDKFKLERLQQPQKWDFHLGPGFYYEDGLKDGIEKGYLLILKLCGDIISAEKIDDCVKKDLMSIDGLSYNAIDFLMLEYLNPWFKKNGFNRKGKWYIKDYGNVVFFLNLQESEWTKGMDETSFTFNLGFEAKVTLDKNGSFIEYKNHSEKERYSRESRIGRYLKVPGGDKWYTISTTKQAVVDDIIADLDYVCNTIFKFDNNAEISEYIKRFDER
jgi:hypothetical protein